MGRHKLTDQDIQVRLQEGRNYKKLYTELKVRFDEVKKENKQLKEQLAEAHAKLDTQAIQIAELQTMVFGKKKKPPTGGTPVASLFIPTAKPPRTKASYKRPIPPTAAITTEVTVSLPSACSCGGSFNQASISTHERYEQDIPLPELTKDYQALLTTRQLIERGICQACGKASSARDLGGAQVALGQNVRLLVTHLIASVGMSYAQTSSLILSLHGLYVSDGEIANILTQQHQNWLPSYQQLKADIRAAPVRHYDETPWRITSADNSGYAWVMSDAATNDTVFHLATSRGGRHAQLLHSRSAETSTSDNKDNDLVYITDDYSAYRTLPGQQQLCWAHLYRTVRDLRYNSSLPENQVAYVTEWYGGFASIYQDLRHYLEQPYDEATRTDQTDELWQRVQRIATKPTLKTSEPDKLRRLKAQLLRAGKDRLLVCLPKNTPCDNNRAERDLRQLVLKRKRSFGSKTEKGAQALATVLSICTTTLRNNPQNYFQQLAQVGV